MQTEQPKRGWILPAKVAALIVVLGPLAGAICFAVVAIAMLVFSAFTGGVDTGPGSTVASNVMDAVQIAPWVVMMGYMFGTLPAAASGVIVSAYMLWTGRRPSRRLALLIGAVIPPLFLAVMGADNLSAFADAESRRNTAVLLGIAAVVGLGAAAISERVINRVFGTV